jgi:hypothetical protein
LQEALRRDHVEVELALQQHLKSLTESQSVRRSWRRRSTNSSGKIRQATTTQND